MGLSARQSFSRDSIVSFVTGDLSPVTNNETASLEFSPLQHISTERDPSGLESGRGQLPVARMDAAIFRVSSARYRAATLMTVSNPFNGLRRFSKLRRALMGFSLRRFKALG